MAGDLYRVCLLGASLDNPNRGVSALAMSLITLISRHCPQAQFFSLYGSRHPSVTTVKVNDRSIPVININFRRSFSSRFSEHILVILLFAAIYRILPFESLRLRICRQCPWIDALHRADLIGEIRGGDSFSDIYGFKKFFFGVLPTFTPLIMGKPLVLLPQTFLPFRSRVAGAMARWIIRHSSNVYARDKNSLQVVREMLGPHERKAHFCPDVAFALEPALLAVPPLTPPLTLTDASVVGININGMLYTQGDKDRFNLNGSYRRFIDQLVERILTQTRLHIVLVPHVFSDESQDDLQPSREVAQAVPPEHAWRVHLLNQPLGPAELKAIIGRCNFFIGSRMHSCIAALSQSIPCIGIAYSGKFSGVFESVGAGSLVIDAAQYNAATLVDHVLNRMQTSSEALELRTHVEDIRRQLNSAFGEITAAPHVEQLHRDRHAGPTKPKVAKT